MPLLAVLATTTQVSGRVDHALFQQRETQGAERRRGDDVESAVTIKQRGIVAVEFQAFLVDQKHRHARAVFAVVKNLLGLVVLWFKSGNVHGAEHGRFLRRDVVLVNRRRKIERGEAVVHVLVITQTAKAAGSSETRQPHFVFELAVETKYIRAR